MSRGVNSENGLDRVFDIPKMEINDKDESENEHCGAYNCPKVSFLY